MIKKILKAIIYIFIALLVIVNVAILVMKISGKEPNILGYHIYYIASGSMEPKIKTGQVIVGKETDISDLAVDQIVTFHGTKGSLSGKIITHRIKKIYEEDGQIYLITKGDAADTEDAPILASDVISVMKFKVPLAGLLIRIISNKYGFFFIVLIPMSIILVKQIIEFSQALKNEESEDTEKLNEKE